MRNLEFVQNVVDYFNKHQSTVRKTAKHFNISKSAVHFYLTEIMPNPTSKAILEKNKKERHIRGGLATKAKYKTLSHDTSNKTKK